MRLNQIKLAGFKSFAEPTTFQLPGQRVGVVGPNGCGKSNIMDAVRWVLGESKASELRGESMQDVIFNGSGNRKPASRASVELVFDNADARAGGQWNTFAEIAVKRVLTRDGSSSYYINNQPVRRRDVQDVFLGTGLGPRAYAIIGQGTISRIIESRPEELRLFLEEAAGVSKYKERRRETENRLKDTRENLTRVEDILRELTSNLEKLEKQAEVATQYRSLQEQGTLKLHQLWFLKHRDAAAEQERVKTGMAEAVNALEARMASCATLKAKLKPSARRTTARPTACTAHKVCWLKRRWKSAGWKSASGTWLKAASVQKRAWLICVFKANNGPSASKTPFKNLKTSLARSAVQTSKARCSRRRPKSKPPSCPHWKTLCARPRAAATSSATWWCRCSSRFKCWQQTAATSKNSRGN